MEKQESVKSVKEEEAKSKIEKSKSGIIVNSTN